ncbi:ribosome-binding factor A [Ferrimonas balearica DSM 9799]|uniref:Ribosome-binding factor A n=1 Tax=Ferrimonas balearica (strain DSM 9799 / CCM 4581 / KCTC 23876 / PAT) TaxID=550540 RepID=E1SSS1_FERBD|nr:30S ribosome-binding factor RbfA [Ferrimonas balearica]MBY6017569.1 30S ribosome-binding factor RbfA [Halomonas denitrificans]ADN77075.1 ribosome-binding factor A [Ferrimonas balearica DSM 9799]MBW3139930.1 30S ribosome-binding factor RbfA [Ferrimonas balearica]MBW3164954.1 30S ribosome-binding factor RbfA [Ferrimonas balearica]MBY5980178.1 30S ribosome-binding factor RbfA [Ferrimonas balearica]
MAREFSRTRRVGQQLQRELAMIIQREIRDERLGMVTVNEVEVSRDMGYAKVFVTFLDDNPEAVKRQMEALLELTPQIRMLTASRVKMRVMPELRFTYDKSLVEGIRMASLVSQARSQDEAKADQFGRDDDEEQQ